MTDRGIVDELYEWALSHYFAGADGIAIRDLVNKIRELRGDKI